MTRAQKISLVFVLMSVGLAWYYAFVTTPAVAKQDVQAVTALRTTINQCDDITERAAAHLVAIVEFQRLEIIGRKARVFKLCMRDRGYQENNAWLAYTLPVAKQVSTTQHISVDEAIENLRRTDMRVSTGEQKRPVFWVKHQPV